MSGSVRRRSQFETLGLSFARPLPATVSFANFA
jgi:hypothetical protein